MQSTRSSNRKRIIVGLVSVSVTVIAMAVGIAPAQAAGDWGPDTCLEGFVWREVNSSDHVCVAGATRAEAAYDNSQAAARRHPLAGVRFGGFWGFYLVPPDTCLSGYVWREAVAGDRVCVPPATRAQAAADNSLAQVRWNALRPSTTTYTIPPMCGPFGCTSQSTDSIPRYRLRVDQVNLGTAKVELRRLDNDALIDTWTPVVSVYPGSPVPSQPGGQVTLDTGVFQCQQPADSYFRTQDPSSTRWSAPYHVSTICSVL